MTDESRASFLDRAAERAAALRSGLPRFVADALGTSEAPEPADDTVEALTAQGLDRDEAVAAVEQGHVPLVLAQHALDGPPRYTLQEIAERSGVSAAVLRDLQVASGLPSLAGYAERDLEWAHEIASMLEEFGVDALVRAARARGAALAAAARSDLGLVRDQVLLPMRQAGADDLEVAVRLAETVREFKDTAHRVLVHDYEAHLRAQLGSELSAVAARAEDETVELAVAFVDVVGYTALSARVDPEGLDSLLDAFEARALEVVATYDDVAIVKYLGDAVMLVAPDATTLGRALLELTREVPALEEAPLRGGLAAGRVRVREGDFFGDPVNLAARLTDAAGAWTVLADEELRDELDASFETRRTRPTRLRGVGLRRPLKLRVRRDDRDEATS